MNGATVISRSLPTLARYLYAVYIPYRLGLRDSTVAQLSIAVTLYSRWLERPARLDDLLDEPVLRFLADYSRDKAASTVNAKRRHLLALWRDAHERGYVNVSPGKIPKIPEPDSLPEAWTIQEVSRVLRAAGAESGTVAGLRASSYWVSLILAMLDTGARIGAMSRVRCSQIRLDDPAGLELSSEFSKTHRAKWCPLHPQTVQSCSWIWDASRELMWPWPYHDSVRRRHLKRLCAKAGVRVGRPFGGVFHKLRRTSGTLVEANGGDGSKQLGNTRAVFLKSYLDPRVAGNGQLQFLPRPEF